MQTENQNENENPIVIVNIISLEIPKPHGLARRRCNAQINRIITINLTTGSIQNEVSIALQSTDAVPAAGTVLNPTKDLLRSLLLFSLSLLSVCYKAGDDSLWPAWLRAYD